MGINYATHKFREDLTNLMNNSGLPICNICMVLNEAKSTADSLFLMTVQSEQQQEQKGKEESEDGKLD